MDRLKERLAFAEKALATLWPGPLIEEGWGLHWAGGFPPSAVLRISRLLALGGRSDCSPRLA